MVRKIVYDCSLVVGCSLVVYACWIISTPLAVGMAGVMLVLLAIVGAVSEVRNAD